MDLRNIIFLAVVSLLLFGAVSAQKNVDDFKIDDSYDNAFTGKCCSLYLNEKQDSGITVYKYGTGDVDDDVNEAYDDLIHDDGMEYLTGDDDVKVDEHSDNTVTFKDYDHAQHGISEVIKGDGEKFIVVFWAKDGSDIDNSKLLKQLKDFNKDNDVKTISL